MTRTQAGLRLSFYYTALFIGVGTQLPFWPLWLKDRGLTPAEIGLIIAVIYVTKVVVNPLIGHVVDKRGDRRRPMVVLAAGAALSWLAFSLTDGFWTILALSVVATGCWSAIMPVGEALALAVAQHHKLDYGRVRLWGSASFILAAVATGQILTGQPTSLLVWLVSGALVLTAISCATLPDQRVPVGDGQAPARLAPLLTSAPFLLFLAAASLNQAAHTVYYGFATIHWKSSGIEGDVIGYLWSEGVVAEILLFAFSGRVVARLGPARLLLIAALAGILRWLVLGTTTALPALAVAQLLHAATFGCGHLGAMHFLNRAVAPGLSARAQGIFAGIAAGAAPGLMSLASGQLYEAFSGGAFLTMAAVSLASGLAAWLLARRWDGGLIDQGADRR
jgi:PPP family 3-phenylpropionic acid transporter